MVHRRHPDFPWSPGPVVAELRRASDEQRRIMDGLRPASPCYEAASKVRRAIADFATLLTGDAQYFSADQNSTPSSATPAERGGLGTSALKRAREDGQEPWAWITPDGKVERGDLNERYGRYGARPRRSGSPSTP